MNLTECYKFVSKNVQSTSRYTCLKRTYSIICFLNIAIKMNIPCLKKDYFYKIAKYIKSYYNILRILLKLCFIDLLAEFNIESI